MNQILFNRNYYYEFLETVAHPSTEATKIDNKGMAKVEQTIAELATDQGIDVSQPIRPSNTEDNQINFPPWVHNNLNHNQFIVASTEDPMLIS